MNVQHERNRLLRKRLEAEDLLRDEVAAELEQPWRTNGVVLQAFFFILTCVALGAFALLCHLLRISYAGLVTAVVAIGIAESLLRRGWFGTGVEAALWIGGLLAAIAELPHSGKPEAVLVIGAAFAMAGARVRNPLFGAVAAICTSHYFEERFDAGVAAALLLAAVALIALLRTWQRPSNESLFVAVALVLPLAGVAYADGRWRPMTIVLYAAFAAIALVLALTHRHHAFFLAAMIGAAVAATELARTIAVAPEAKLAVAGALLLGLAFAITRALRDRTHGFVLTPAKLTPIDEELELAATMSMKPEIVEGEPAKRGGGAFGGAGVSGDF